MASVANKITCLMLAGCLGLTACGSNGDDEPVKDAGPVVPDVKLSYEALLQACIGLSACGIQRRPRLRDCVDNYHKVLAQSGVKILYNIIYDCVNKAKGNCKTIYKCMGFAERPQDPKLMCDSSTKAKCVGSVAHNCDLLIGGWSQKIDCATAGLTCAVKDTGSGKLAAICGGGSCNVKTYKARCQGDKHLKCVGGAIEINDCGAQFLQCRESHAGCEGTGRSTKTINPVCKGNVLTQSKNNYLWQIDCAKIYGQKKCDSTSNECKGKGTQCSEDSFFDGCDATLTKLTTCLDGYKKEFDCKALGYDLGCKKASTYGAYCKPKSVHN